MVGAVMEGQECGDTGVHGEDDVPATATIATIRSPERLELLTMDRSATVSTITGYGVELDLIDKCGHLTRLSLRPVDRSESGVDDDVDNTATAGGAKFDATLTQGKKRVIFAAANIGAGVEMSAPLANDDLSCADQLAPEALHAKALSVGVATVPGARCTLLMRHDSRLRLDSGHLDAGEVLTVPLTATVTGLVLVSQDADLGTTLVAHDLGRDRDSGQCGGVGSDGTIIDEHEGGQLHGRAGLSLDTIHNDDVADGDLLLPASGSNNGVHVVLPVAIRPGVGRFRRFSAGG